MRIKSQDFGAGQYFHIYNHAVADSLLFREDEDYFHFLKLMSKYYSDTDFSMLAYCLMPNHYHFLMQQKNDVPLFVYFSKLCHDYAIYYNKKHNNKGTIFRSKLQHIMIDHDTYLGYLCSYIHLNPVKAGLVFLPEEWAWSNYCEFIGIRKCYIIDLSQRDFLFSNGSVYQNLVNDVKIDRIDSKYLIDD